MVIERDQNKWLPNLAEPERCQMMEIAGSEESERCQLFSNLSVKALDNSPRYAITELRSPGSTVQNAPNFQTVVGPSSVEINELSELGRGIVHRWPG
jgi:hypothetical protein